MKFSAIGSGLAKLLLPLLVCTMQVWAGKTAPLTINWTFRNVVEGFDYDFKLLVYVDGQLSGETPVFKQSSLAHYELDVPKGEHEIFIQGYAMYDGNWDVHTIANNYSIDAQHKQKLNITKKTSMEVIFDLDVNVPEVNLLINGKPPKVKMGVLHVDWMFTGLHESKNRENKLMIYVDGKLMGESKTFLESEAASMTLRVPQGMHSIHIENSTSFEGKWEPHTKANGYALDATYKGSVNFDAEGNITLVFDIEEGETKAVVK